jgi:hypothetical protein
MVLEAVVRFSAFAAAAPDGHLLSFRVCGLRGWDARVSTLHDDLIHLQASAAVPAELRGTVAADFERRWNIPARAAEHLVIDDRDFRRDSAVCRAVFASAVRSAYDVGAHTDATLDRALQHLADELFAPARRHGGYVSLRRVEEVVLLPLTPHRVVLHESAWLRTGYGYVRDLQRDRELRAEQTLVRRAQRQVWSRWRRHTLAARLAALLVLGPVRCPGCGHALTANFGGRGGFACTYCGFVPFATLFYACGCGSPVALVDRPDTASRGLYGDLLRLVAQQQPSCTVCGTPVEAVRLATRVFVALVPWPLEGSVTEALVELREALGHTAQEPLTPAEAQRRLLGSRNRS